MGVKCLPCILEREATRIKNRVTASVQTAVFQRIAAGIRKRRSTSVNTLIDFVSSRAGANFASAGDGVAASVQLNKATSIELSRVTTGVKAASLGRRSNIGHQGVTASVDAAKLAMSTVTTFGSAGEANIGAQVRAGSSETIHSRVTASILEGEATGVENGVTANIKAAILDVVTAGIRKRRSTSDHTIIEFVLCGRSEERHVYKECIETR